MIIADVAVTQCHQRRDEIRIIFTRTSSKSCFLKKLSCNIYALDTSHFSLHSTRLRACYKYVPFTWFRCAHYRQKNNSADCSIVWVKIIKFSSRCWWRFLTATSVYCILLRTFSNQTFAKFCNLWQSLPIWTVINAIWSCDPMCPIREISSLFGTLGHNQSRRWDSGLIWTVPFVTWNGLFRYVRLPLRSAHISVYSLFCL